jgi:glyoxylase-like metal-dependent hydrolase (beta-lactamase superfamily II)
VPFTEVAQDVWVARYEWFDVNVTVVRGGSGLLVVDTHASATAAREVLDDVRALGAGDVVAVVNTHEHFDHTFGNGVFRTAYGDIPIHAHEEAAERTVSAGERIKGLYNDPENADDPHRAEVLETEIVPADTTFSSAVVLDLGGRPLELIHPGRGHTGGDLVVRVPDADVLLAGDLVESSDRYPTPGLGGDCFPLDWPLSLDLVIGLLGTDTVVVPGHGAPVGRDFVEQQRNTLGIVGETIRDLSTRGVPVGEALDAADWPYPREDLAQAVIRGYEQLPRSQKRLPLV